MHSPPRKFSEHVSNLSLYGQRFVPGEEVGSRVQKKGAMMLKATDGGEVGKRVIRIDPEN